MLTSNENWPQQVVDQYVDKNLHEATLIDEYTYKVEDLTYRQRVYRMKDHSIYVETTPIENGLKELLVIALAEERYEDAKALLAELRELEKT